MSAFASLRHKFLYYVLTSKVELTRLGSPCVWEFCPTGLNSKSRIVCAGAGGDISFEAELHQLTGAEVHLLDPSPTGIETYRKAPPVGVVYHEVGLAGDSSNYTFALPRNPDEGSYKEPRFDSEGMETVTFKCLSIDDFMASHDIKSIDLFKMDIEGFEYDVLDSIIKRKIPIRQICVEFHNLRGHLLSGIIRYLWIIRLRLNGYHLISHVGTTDHTFLKF